MATQGVEWMATWIFRFCFDAYIVRAGGDAAHTVLCEYSYDGHLPGKPESCTFYEPTRTSSKPNQQVSNKKSMSQHQRYTCNFNFIVAIRCVRTMVAKKFPVSSLCAFFFSLPFIVRCSMYKIPSICRSVVSHTQMYTIYVFTMLAQRWPNRIWISIAPIKQQSSSTSTIQVVGRFSTISTFEYE